MNVRQRWIEPGWITMFCVALALGAAIAAALAHVAAPRADPAGQGVQAGPGAFSSARALLHLGRIAATPHPTGTPANAAVRAYLVAQLQGLGLAPEVQGGVEVAPGGGAAGHVRNVIARLPGREPGPALMLAAHYDSAPTSPGAADDGASVAAILETLRALRSGPPLRHDLVVLFTDGEEPGLLGAQLFTAHHRFARQVGAVLNFDYRGNTGALWMFETGSASGALVRAWRSAAPAPMGNSLLAEVYKRMPNGTDLSVFRQAGMQGLNFAAIGGHTNYHTGLDTVERLDRGTLQRQGDTMLALARRLGETGADPSAAASAPGVYLDLPLAGVAGYPAAFALPLALLLAALSGVAAWRGCRHAGVRARAAAAAAPLFIVQVAVVGVACQLLWTGIQALHPAYRLMLHGEPYNAAWYLGAFACLATALFLVLARVLARWLSVAELALGALGCWVALALLAAVLVPGASFLLAWPALFASLALLAVFGGRGTPAARCAVLTLGLLPAVLLVVPVLAVLAGALTLAAIGVPAALGAMLLGLAGPALALLARLRPASVAALAGVACLAGGAASAGFDAHHPQPYNLFYLADADSGAAFWLSADEQPDPWTQRHLAHAVRRQVPALYGNRANLLWAAPAPAGVLAAPALRVLADRSDASGRTLVLALQSVRAAPMLSVAVDGATVLRARVNDEPLTTQARARWKAGLHGFGDASVRLELRLAPQQGHFRLRVADVSYDLIASSLAGAPPAQLLAQPFGASATMQAVRTLAF